MLMSQPRYTPITTPQAPPAARPGKVGRPRKSALAEAGALGRERIFQAALALIDAQGLAAFGIRGLATQLGVAPAAIYWHVASREDLVYGALSIALADVAQAMPPGSWQLRIQTVLRRFRATLRQHPHLAPAVANELGCNATLDTALMEHIVAALEEAHFDGQALVDAVNVVVAAMCGFATLELSTAPAGPDSAWGQACRAQVEGIDPARCPALARHQSELANHAFLMRWTGGMDNPLDTGFEAWVDVLIGGLEARSRVLLEARES